MKSTIFIICDGLGDIPVAGFRHKTPLESAKTPNLDKMAEKGICGIMHTVSPGIAPESHTAHLAIFGYAPEKYDVGRGVYEVMGLGMKTKAGDVCLRGNMGTVDEGLRITDRRAGRIDNTSEFVQLFNRTKINGVEFLLKSGTAYRVGIIMRGKGLSSNITDADPHRAGQKVQIVKPLDNSEAAKKTADALNKFLLVSYKKLKDLRINKQRAVEGKPPANFFLVRGAGQFIKIKPFEKKYKLSAVCIAGAGLYKGIAKALGMDIKKIKGVTGKPDTNIKAKITKALLLKNKYQFVFVHIKAADSLGEDGNCKGKREFIEKIDQALKPLTGLKDTLIVVTADHSTPCKQKAHSADPVPVLFYTADIKPDSVKHFSEKECQKGKLGTLLGKDMMPFVIAHMKNKKMRKY